MDEVSLSDVEAQRKVLVSAFSAPLRLCVMLCLPLGCSESSVNQSAQSAIANSGIALPLTDLDGDQIVASGANNPIVFIFVLADCPICNSYVPEFNRLHAEYSDRGATIVLVHADSEITTERARDHAGEYNIQCPVAFDQERMWVKKFGITTAPEAAVFSPSGELLYRGRIDDQYVGLGKRRTVVTSHDLRDVLEAILTGKTVTQPRTEAVGCPIPK